MFDSCILFRATMIIATVAFMTPGLAAEEAAPASVAIDAAGFFDFFTKQYTSQAPERLDGDRAEESYKIGRGLKFDPQLSATTSRSADEKSVLLDARPSNQLQLSQDTPWGTSLSSFYSKQPSVQAVTLGTSNNPTTTIPSVSTGTVTGSGTTDVVMANTFIETAGVSVGQQLLKGGFYGGLVVDEMNRLDNKSALITAQQRHDDALLAALDAFLSYDETRQNLKQAQASLISAQGTRKMVEQLVHGGYKAKADLLVVETGEIRAQQDLDAAQLRKERSYADLRKKLWFDDDAERLEVGSCEFASPIVTRIDQLVAMPAAQAPVVRLADLKARKAELSTKKALRDTLPGLSLNYTAQKNITPGADSNYVSETLSLNFTLAIGGTFGAHELKLARIDRDVSATEYMLAKREDQRQLQLLKAEVVNQTKDFTARTRLYTLSEKSLAIEKQKYADGKSTIIDVKKFQDDLDAAGLGRAAAAKQLLLSKFNLLNYQGQLGQVFTHE